MKEFKNNYGSEKSSKNNHNIKKDQYVKNTQRRIKVFNNASSLNEIKQIKNNVKINEMHRNRDFSFDHNINAFYQKKQNFLEKSKNLKIGNNNNLNKISKKGNKILYIKNNKFSKTQRKNYSNVVACVHKKGLLYLMNQINNKSKLKAKEVPIKLTPDKLEIFQTFHKGSSIKIVNLNEISRITQRYSNTNCFDLVLINKPFVRTTLCAKSKQGMNEWIHAILAFKQCRNNVILDKKNKKVFIKFENCSPSTNKSKRYGNKLEDLFYHRQSSAFNSNKLARDSGIKKRISNILHTIQMTDAAHSQLRRRFDGKISRARKNSDEMIRKQLNIKKLLEKKALQQSKKENHLLILEQKHKELKLLKEVEDKINKIKVPFYLIQLKELKGYRKKYENQLRAEKNRPNIHAKDIFKIILNQKKLTDYKECYAKNLQSNFIFNKIFLMKPTSKKFVKIILEEVV